ncbi:MAG: YggS family pyridoxal phosphate-dependent enzyme [Candidatus Eremiobacteraeota bacterium]|nr:YggS family pyridoxal phosphate-dependent enzyme [Candidatus Eremiobacteraeota bacterium]
MLSKINENLGNIKERIKASAEKSGRNAQDIILVAVSKTFPVEYIEEVYRSGVREFGENYIQESIEKIDHLDISARWHFMGHLQANKVRTAVKYFPVIQSIDSRKLLKRINQIAGEEGKKPDVLIEVNLVGEESKFGVDPSEVYPILDDAQSYENVKVCGLMLLPPFYDDPEKNRINFRKLKQMADEIDKKDYSNWKNKYLSMGMTDDFEIAIEEGSNMVRIGRAIFGPRRR